MTTGAAAVVDVTRVYVAPSSRSGLLQAALQSGPGTSNVWPRLFAKQAGQGEGAQVENAAEAASSSGDEAGAADAAGAADNIMDVAELQELLEKAQEEVRMDQ